MLCVAIVTIVSPLSAQIPQPTKSDCCGEIVKDQAGTDRSHHCPTDSPKEKQCCAACAMSLMFLWTATGVLLFPPDSGELMDNGTMHGACRTDRPLVPPPRVGVV
jgi:hypothetical protein